MPYKSIVSFVHDHATDMPAVLTAASLADEVQAHLSVVCLGIDRTNPGAYYGGANAIALQQSLELAEAEARQNEETVAKSLGVWSLPWETIPITAQVGALTPVISDRAQLADLIVLPKPYAKNRGVEDVVILESALFRTRVPVLELPEGHDSAPKA